MSSVVSLVSKRLIESTLPTIEFTLMTSPRLNLLKTTKIIPLARLDKESFSDKAIAKPAVPKTAIIEVVLTPRLLKAVIKVRSKIPAKTTFFKKTPKVSSLVALMIALEVYLERILAR